ncbi:hypothetical protein KAJ38_02820 [Candidatus Pacearchaeota archaeon]|nr:hypothetical protein [Candidatus Pacearchaeota archaeon]
MDEKELIKRVRNSFSAKKSRAEILTGFQKRGYKLAYADKLISKASRPNRTATLVFLTILVVFFIAFGSYSLLDKHKMELSNPLSSTTGNTIATFPDIPQQEREIDQIEITSEFISYLLNELAAWKLHKNPLNFEKPIINFKIGDKDFHSEIDNEIITYEGLSQKADLQIDTNKADLIKAISSNNSEDVLKQSLANEKTQLNVFASEAELFSKGYFKFYNFLK